MEIREYQTVDKEACLAIFRSNIPKFFLAKELAEFDEFLDKWALGAYWVLQHDHQIIACGGIGVRNNMGRLHYGMVLFSHHKKGIGSRLIKFRLAKLIENSKVTSISLDTSQHNPEFFRRFGFIVTLVKGDAYGVGLHRHDMLLELPNSAQERDALRKSLLRSEDMG